MTEFAHVRRGNPAWRILVELAGRAEPVSLRDLCETAGLEPTAAADVIDKLWLDSRVEHPERRIGGEWWQITWQGQDALRRLDEQVEHAAAGKRHWWQKAGQ